MGLGERSSASIANSPVKWEAMTNRNTCGCDALKPRTAIASQAQEITAGHCVSWSALSWPRIVVDKCGSIKPASISTRALHSVVGISSRKRSGCRPEAFEPASTVFLILGDLDGRSEPRVTTSASDNGFGRDVGQFFTRNPNHPIPSDQPRPRRLRITASSASATARVAKSGVSARRPVLRHKTTL